MNVLIVGCGTVGGGVAKILLELKDELSFRAGQEIRLFKIIEPFPEKAIERFSIPAEYFCGNGKNLSMEEIHNYLNKYISSNDIDLVIETVGGTDDFVFNLALQAIENKKFYITANKALLAERGKEIFCKAEEKKIFIGYEAAVCGAIPIIKTINESFTGDKIESISGIFNGTSNYILSSMHTTNLSFNEALKDAQIKGYAESNPYLDISGRDAAHKLILLVRLAFGVSMNMEDLCIKGIDDISNIEIDFAREIDATIKLIAFAIRINGSVYATVCPMMVKNSNMLAKVNGVTNAVRLVNKYGGKHILIGNGAGSSETASSIVSDIVFAARYGSLYYKRFKSTDLSIVSAEYLNFPYIIMFKTKDIPGITGLVTTAIGNQQINIDTVSHNRHSNDYALFSVATMPCNLNQLKAAIEEIKSKRSDVLLEEPKIMPVLY